jgi:hypothetical protein
MSTSADSFGTIAPVFVSTLLSKVLAQLSAKITKRARATVWDNFYGMIITLFVFGVGAAYTQWKMKNDPKYFEGVIKSVAGDKKNDPCDDITGFSVEPSGLLDDLSCAVVEIDKKNYKLTVPKTTKKDDKFIFSKNGVNYQLEPTQRKLVKEWSWAYWNDIFTRGIYVTILSGLLGLVLSYMVDKDIEKEYNKGYEEGKAVGIERGERSQKQRVTPRAKTSIIENSTSSVEKTPASSLPYKLRDVYKRPGNKISTMMSQT